MENVLIHVYQQLLVTHRCSVDRILEDPELRQEFVGRVRESAVDASEFVILHGLNNLRKKSKLPRRAG